MIKYALLGLLCFTHVAHAQTAIEQALEKIGQNQPVEMNLISLANKEQNVLANETDRVLSMLLSIPFEQRQYIYPALFNYTNLPKKIRQHPEIAIWEGKVPTTIAPQAEEYARKYLYDMKPEMYIYLSPDAYTKPKDSAESSLTSLPGQAPFSFKVISSDKPYAPLESLIDLPDDLKQNPHLALLSEEKIKHIGQGLSVFNQTLQDLKLTNDRFNSGYRFLSLFRPDVYEEKVNPFQEQLKRIRLLKEEEKFDKAMRQAGFQNTADFALTADTIAKAYRVSSMPLLLSFENRRFRAQQPKTQIEKMAYTAARMYEALPEDVHLVIKNKNAVRQNFIQNGYQSILNGISIDELEK